MKRPLNIIALACVAMLAAVSCARTAVDPETVYRDSYASYVDVQREWMRNAKIYHNFDTELIVDALYYSPSFRAALLGERVRAEKLAADEAGRLERADKAELARTVRFMVSAYTPSALWNNLDRKDPSFRLWLLDADGKRSGPPEVRLIKLKTRADRRYFPFVTEWSKVYEVLFPNFAEDGQALRLAGGKVALVVAGVQGETRLVWEIPE